MAKKLKTSLPGGWPRALLIGGNIGGIGKTSYLALLAGAMTLAELPIDLLQLDDQAKLARLTGLPVTSLDIAIFRKGAEDSWAAQRALRPLYDAVAAMPETGRSVGFEIGGGASSVAHDGLRLIDLADEVEELGLTVDAHIVVVASEESVRQAVIEVARVRETLPRANVVLVLNNRYGSVKRFVEQTSPDIATPMAKLLDSHPSVTMGQVRPDVMRLWERLGVQPPQIVRWRMEGGYARVCAETGLDRFEARLFGGELVGWAELVRESLIALYPDLEKCDA
jgi:hypothetical protein